MIMIGLAVGFGNVLGIAVKCTEKLLVSVGRMGCAFRDDEFVLNEETFAPHRHPSLLIIGLVFIYKNFLCIYYKHNVVVVVFFWLIIQLLANSVLLRYLLMFRTFYMA